MVQLTNYLATLAAQQPEVPTVVGGDFNICPQVVGRGGFDDGSQYRHLCTSMGRCGLRDLYSAGDSEATQEDATLDHLFLVGGVAPAWCQCLLWGLPSPTARVRGSVCRAWHWAGGRG